MSGRELRRIPRSFAPEHGGDPPMTAGLALTLDIPSRCPLDEPLVVLARLENGGSQPVTTSSRLNLLEGDLTVAVTTPGGAATPVVWPWPIDSARREVTLEPAQRLEGGVLLHWGVGGPLFPAAGRYTVSGEFAPTPLEAVVADPDAVLRDEAPDQPGLGRQRLLLDADVARSLASASVLGRAAEGLAELSSSEAPLITRFLAAFALGETTTVAGLAAEADPVGAATWTTAVLPAGLFAEDERVRAVAEVVAGHGRAAAILSGRPA
jgi:hypothetical protein